MKTDVTGVREQKAADGREQWPPVDFYRQNRTIYASIYATAAEPDWLQKWMNRYR